MYKQIIDSKNETDIIFLRCHCGGEIISIYYYPATTTCQEIIFLDYYGYIKSKYLYKYKHYSFNRDLFEDFINALERCELEGPYEKNIKCPYSYLNISKLNHNFTELKLCIDRKLKSKNKQPIKIWDITIRDKELVEFVSRLKQMQNKILEVYE